MKDTRERSDDFKKAAVKKFLTRGRRTVQEIANEIGVNQSTLYDWKRQFSLIHDHAKQSKPHSRSVMEKLKALKEYFELPVEKRGEYLRGNGLHEEHLTNWQNQIEEALSTSNRKTKEHIELIAEKKKTNELEKELRRKDKALAEASALLILKKKADMIWGTKEDE